MAHNRGLTNAQMSAYSRRRYDKRVSTSLGHTGTRRTTARGSLKETGVPMHVARELAQPPSTACNKRKAMNGMTLTLTLNAAPWRSKAYRES
jgi:hypothetical protein